MLRDTEINKENIKIEKEMRKRTSAKYLKPVNIVKITVYHKSHPNKTQTQRSQS